MPCLWRGGLSRATRHAVKPSILTFLERTPYKLLRPEGSDTPTFQIVVFVNLISSASKYVRFISAGVQGVAFRHSIVMGHPRPLGRLPITLRP